MSNEAGVGQSAAAEDRGSRKRRGRARRGRITGHTAFTWADAEQWDLEFWQRQTPQARLSALVALRNDVVAVRGKTATLDWDD